MKLSMPGFRASLKKRTVALFAVVLLALVGQAAAAEKRFQVQDGTFRVVKTPTTNTVDLYVEGSKDKFEEKYSQGNPPYENGCGPVAVRNLFYWYGIDIPGPQLWSTLANEMATNHAAEGIDTHLACTGLCGAVPPCVLGCVKLIESEGNKGSRPSAVVNSMKKHAPRGYTVAFHAHYNGLDALLEPLSQGNPVIALINSGHHMNHYVVVTGIYEHPPAGRMVRLANNKDLPWADFVKSWSLAGFGDTMERSFMDEIVGDKPYFVAYYSPVKNRQLGQFCMAHEECSSHQCDSRVEAGCVPNGNGKGGDICTDHNQCSSKRCIVPPGKIAGKCTANDLGLGKKCATHNECASGLCDNRPGAGCVPKGNGKGGDICTDHNQCSSKRCIVPPGKIAGKCTASTLSLGKKCATHNECASGLCDNRPGAGCVPKGNGKKGEICTDHNQCSSKRCIVPPGKIAGKCSASNLSLGQNCGTHNECASGLCDNRPGAGCVPKGNGKGGDICTDHNQCGSKRCIVPPGKIAGKCARK